MGVFLSPGVYDREVDFSTNVVGSSTTVVGMVGGFSKGPVMERTLVTSGSDLVRKFGKPHKDSYAGLAALQYLAYGRQLWIVRIAGTDLATAKAEIEDNDAVLGLTVEASSPGTWANDNVKFIVSDLVQQRAMAKINEGVLNGEVSIFVVAPGSGGNAYTVNVVVDDTQEHTLDASFVNDILTITLATESDGMGGWQLNPSANTALLVATAVATLAEFTATYSGTGAGVLSLAEEVSFTDGEFTTFRAKVQSDGVIVEDKYDVNFNSESTDGSYIEDAFKDSKWVVVTDEKEDWSGTYIPAGTYELTGGNDGITGAQGIQESNKVSGVEMFSNPEDIDINLLIAPGYSEDAVIVKMISICEERGDCMAIIDPPLGLDEQEVVEWHNEYQGRSALNSSYAALYWDWVQVYDAYNGDYRWVPPSGLVSGVYAYSDYIGEPWFAPAGFIRGRIFRAVRLGLNSNPGLGSRDFMYSGGNAVNPIVSFPQDGITIWGQRTLQRKPSATDRVNIRRLLLHVRKAVVRSTRYFVFEPNDNATWLQWKNMVIPFLDSIRVRRGLYDFRVVMDETTVTPEDIDNNRMPGKILLKPTKSAEFIPIDFVLYKTGASFSD